MVILLNVDLAQIKLKSPLILASGILGTSIPYFRNLEKDIGSITTKSIGVKPSFGHETPNIIPLKNQPRKRNFKLRLQNLIKIC